MRANDPLACPVCKGDLRFVSSATWGGPRLYAEVFVYDCPKDGTVFLTREGLTHGPADTDSGDSLIPVPRKPTPTHDAGAIAMPEPNSSV